MILLVASRAHAMGVYITFNLVAWSSDGSSALLVRDEASSGTVGSSHGYVLVSATDKPVTYMETDTLDPDKATEKVTPAICKKTGEDLSKALAAKKFKGVDVKAGGCTATVSADVAKAAKASITDKPKAGSPGEAAIKLVNYSSPNAPTQAALTSGKLVLVLYGDNGDSSTPAHVDVLVPAAKGGFTNQGDLRN